MTTLWIMLALMLGASAGFLLAACVFLAREASRESERKPSLVFSSSGMPPLEMKQQSFGNRRAAHSR